MHPKIDYKNHKLEFNVCKREPYNFKRECIETAKLMAKEAEGRCIYVLFSGGVDGEVVSNSFIDANINFTCVTAKFNDNLNYHDIKWSIDFCREKNINHILLDFNISEFWNNEIFYYAGKTRCTSPQAITPLWISDQINDGYVVICSGNTNYKEDKLFFKEMLSSWWKYFTYKKGTPSFFLHTPEILLSFIREIREDTIKSTYYYHVDENNLIYNTSQDLRDKIYKKYWPDMKKRPIYTGYENIWNEDLEVRAILQDMYCDSDRVYQINIDELIEKIKP